MALVGWELPLFSSDLEPHELKRLPCSACAAAWAEIQCHQCNQQLCGACAAQAHEAANHEDDPEPCNVCQDCQANGPDLYCRDCARHQCELCCVAAHNSTPGVRTHVWFSTEGAPSSLTSHSIWDPTFRKYTKMVRRRQQHTMTQTHDVVKQEPGALPDYLPLTPPNDDDDDGDATSDEGDLPSVAHDQTTSSTRAQETVEVKSEPRKASSSAEEEAVESKMERVRLSDADQSSNVDGPPPPQQQQPVETPVGEMKTEPQARQVMAEPLRPQLPATTNRTVAIKTEPRVRSLPARRQASARHDVVDLTGDDDEDDQRGNAPPAQIAPHVKAEPPPAPMTSAFAEEDLIRTAMICEYNKLSQHIVETEQQRAQLAQRAASGSAQDIQDILACKQQLEGLKTTVMNTSQSRNAAIARLLIYLHGSDLEFVRKLRGDAAMDHPDAQTAFHRRLRDIQATIDQQLVELHAAKNQLDNAVAGGVYDQLVRLGTDVSTREQQVRTLEAQRLDAFLQLAHVSAAVRREALALVNGPPAAP